MAPYDIIRTLSQTTTHSLRQLRAFNPLTIHRKGKKTKAVFALALVCFLWGTTWIAAKKGVEYMPALQLAGMRQLFGGIIYCAFFLYKGATLPKGKEWIPVIILSILNFVLSNGLSNWGIQYISAGLGAIIGSIFPLWLVIIGLFASREKISVKAIIGLLLGFGGVCIIFYEHLDDFLDDKFRIGITISLIATWTWAFGTLYTKKKAANFNPYFSLGLQMLISGTFLLVITRTLHSPPDMKLFVPFTAIPWQSWVAIAFLVIFGSLIAFIAYLYAIQNLPIEQASIYAYVNPIVAVLLGWLLLGDHVTPFIGIGGAIALLGVFMVNRAFRAIPPPEQPEPEGV